MIERKGEYGVDAPYVPLMMGVGALALLLGSGLRGAQGDLGGLLSMGLSGLFLAGCAASYVYTTRAGKFRAWDAVLESLALTGDEAVLDVGCGRGAVLLLAAQRLVRGRATGIDLWQAKDQSGNGADATRKNAEVEGVSDRVDIQTADMCELPFPDGTFDVVVSSLAIHNVPTSARRSLAIREAARVLKPGGRVVLADFRFTTEYAVDLERCGLRDVEHRSLGPRFWYGGPWASTRLVSARKPT